MSDNKTMHEDLTSRVITQEFTNCSIKAVRLADRIIEWHNEQSSELAKEIDRLNNTIVRLRAENLQTEVKLGLAQSELSESRNTQNHLCLENDELKTKLEASERLNTKHVGYIEKLESEFEKCKKSYDEVEEARVKMSLAYTDALFELTELKEKHKKDVMEAYGDGWQKTILK